MHNLAKRLLRLGAKPSSTTDSLFQDEVFAAASASCTVTSPQQMSSVDHTADIHSPSSSPGSTRRRRQWNNVLTRAFARLWPTFHITETMTQSITTSVRSSQLHQRPQQQHTQRRQTGTEEIDVVSKVRELVDCTTTGGAVDNSIKNDVTKNEVTAERQPDVLSNEHLYIDALVCFLFDCL